MLARLALFSLVLLTAACAAPAAVPARVVIGSGAVVTESRPVAAGFDRVVLSGVGTVDLRVGESESLAVRADENVLPHLVSRVRGRDLELAVEPGIALEPLGGVTYTVTVPHLSAVSVDGAGRVRATGLAGDALRVRVAGAGSVVVDGHVDAQDVVITGVGRYDAGALRSRAAVVTVQGAGWALVDASEQLRARIDGAGSVQYRGDPRVEREINGIGVVRPAAG
jgi:hypothetical protein